MAQASVTEKAGVSAEKFLETVLAYEEYPKFVEGCKRVNVDRANPDVTKVHYFVSMMKDVEYTLEHRVEPAKPDGSRVMRWALVNSTALKKNNGHWTIRPTGPASCEVEYTIDIEFSFSIPSFILSKLVKGSLPSMIRGFEKYAKARA